MPTQLDLKRRIRSVKNTQQITRAMKFVAAARLRRAQERAVTARHYSRALKRLVHSVALRVPEKSHPLLDLRPEKRVLLLVVSGERGLCGAFNANVTRRAMEFLRSRASQELELITLGRKGRDTMRKQRWKIVAEYVDITSRPDRAHSAEIAQKVSALYEAGEVDGVYIVFNEFKSVLAQTMTLEKLLPIEPEAPAATATAGETPVEYLYEAPRGEFAGAFAAAIRGNSSVPRVGGIERLRTRGANDGHGFGHQ